MLGPGEDERGGLGVIDWDSDQVVAELAADGGGEDGDHATQGDEVEELPEVVDLGSVRAVLSRPGPAREGLPGEVVPADPGAAREAMRPRHHEKLRLGQEVLGVQAGEVMVREVKQGGVGATLPQEDLTRTEVAHQFDRQRTGLSLIGLEDRGQQATVAAGLDGQDQTRAGAAGPPGAVRRGRHGLEHRTALAEQDGPRLGQCDPATATFQQGYAQPSFELLNGPGERRLGHPQPGGRPAEVQLFGDSGEVDELADLQSFHTRTVSLGT